MAIKPLKSQIQAIEKAKKEKEKEMLKKFKQQESERKEKEKHLKTVPPNIGTMIKRVSRINDHDGVVMLNPYDSNLVIYFKLRQKKYKADDIRILVNAKHSWVEFKFDKRWYIFDIQAKRKTELGIPIQAKDLATAEIYKMMSQTYSDIDEYMEKFDDKITMTKEEAMRYAMEDEGLNSVMIMKYH